MRVSNTNRMGPCGSAGMFLSRRRSSVSFQPSPSSGFAKEFAMACCRSRYNDVISSGDGMSYVEDLEQMKGFVLGRDSWTMTRDREGPARADRVKGVTDTVPLYPFAHYPDYNVPVTLLDDFAGATRDPRQLIPAWWRALWLAKRVSSVTPAGSMLIITGDGIKDKSGLYHMGIRFAEDLKTMSRYSQRDFIVGKLSESNSFHMLPVSALIRVTVAYCQDHAIPYVLSCDMESLRAVSAGIKLLPWKACFSDARQGQAPLHSTLMRTCVAHERWVAP